MSSEKEKPSLNPTTGNRYKVTICKDGKFAITFDTVNLRIRILENTDHRPFRSKHDKDSSSDHSESDNKIDKTIAHFRINNDFEIVDLEEGMKNDDSHYTSSNIVTTTGEDKFMWTFDMSNLRERDNKYFILVAVSRINIEEDMRGNTKYDHNYEKGFLTEKKYIINDGISINMSNSTNPIKGTAIYHLELEKEPEQQKDTYTLKRNTMPTIYYCGSVSGICKFVEVTEPDTNEQERFMVLNFFGIYNFEFDDLNEDIRFNLNEKFEYPKSIRRELDNWHTNTDDEDEEDTKSDCMRRLRSCIYDKYFLVTQYKNDVQSLEVYNLAKMELETSAKKVENKDKFVKRYNYDNFTISRLQLCFTRGINRVRLYYLENGLQVASKKFDAIEKIHLLESIDSDEKILIIGRDSREELKFIIWDLYNTDKVIPITLDECSIEDIDQTSGNIIHVDNKGNVTSVLKRIENKLKKLEEKKDSKINRKAKCIECNNDKHHTDEPNKCKYNIYYDEGKISNLDKKDILEFNKVAEEIEPWVLSDNKKTSYCLSYKKKGTETEFLQLIVCRSTIQIWHHFLDKPEKKDHLPNKGDPFLEYIWTNGIPVDQERKETRLRIKNFKYRSNYVDDESNDKVLNDFSLEVYWYIRKHGKKDKKVNQDRKTDKDKEIIAKENEEILEFEMEKVTNETSMYVEKRTMVIKWRDIIETFQPIRHACKALKHLNKRYIYKCLADNYKKVHKYEEIITYIKHIVWRFAKHRPEQFNLLDVRYNFMKSLILSDCDHLIKFILFGDEGSNENDSKEKEKKKREKKKELEIIRHIPRNKLWPGRKFIRDDDLDFSKKENRENVLKDNENIKPENDMELAIYHCRGRELKDTIMIAYLLEYYSTRATDCAGWMCTVSKALPLLFKYNCDDYARKLFHKECFANQDHFSAQDPDEIIPEEYLERRNHDITFRAFRPTVKLASDQQEWLDRIFKLFKDFKIMIFKWTENFDNDLGKSSLALRIVPLPGFTINNIPKNKVKYNFFRVILNIFWLIFIPRWYRIKRTEKHNKLSPFSRMVLYENNDDIYDNPATEAVIDFCWREAKYFFYLFYIRFLIFAVCFGAVSWEYLNHNADISGTSLIVLIVIFYYLATYQLVTEILQLFYQPRDYISDIYNAFDIISIVLPATIMTVMVKNFQLSDGFNSVETVDTGLLVGVSFSIFFLWIELILYLRIISATIGIYIYYSLIIFYTIFPFLLFMFILVIAFAHTMFILLRDPVNDNINVKSNSFSGNATNANETFNINLQADFDPSSSDNPFSYFPSAIMAAFFWFNGNWIQTDDFDFWAINVFTLIAGIFLVIYLQNVLIAFMSGEFTRAETKGRQTLLRQRAELIADYEALHHVHLWKHDHEPKNIFYFGQSNNFEDWFRIIKDEDAIYKGFEDKSTFTGRIFKEEDYDKVSILKDDDDIIEKETSKNKNLKDDVINNIHDSIDKFKNQENEIYIKYIKDTIKSMLANVDEKKD